MVLLEPTREEKQHGGSCSTTQQRRNHAHTLVVISSRATSRPTRPGRGQVGNKNSRKNGDPTRKFRQKEYKGRLSGVAHVLDLALGIPGHLLVQEQGHAPAVALAVDARDERLPPTARAGEGRGGHDRRGRGGGHVRGGGAALRVRDRHGADAVARGAGELARGPAVRARRELLDLVDLELGFDRVWVAGWQSSGERGEGGKGVGQGGGVLCAAQQSSETGNMEEEGMGGRQGRATPKYIQSNSVRFCGLIRMAAWGVLRGG